MDSCAVFGVLCALRLPLVHHRDDPHRGKPEDGTRTHAGLFAAAFPHPVKAAPTIRSLQRSWLPPIPRQHLRCCSQCAKVALIRAIPRQGRGYCPQFAIVALCRRRRLRIVLTPVNTLWGLSLLHERSLIRRRRLKGAFQRIVPAERFCSSTSQRRRHVCSFLTRKRNSRFCSRPWPA